jgi:GNAT superfamily N-acetyltransferase
VPIRRANTVDAEAVAHLLLDSFRAVERFYTRAGYAATTPDASAVRERLKEGPAWVAEESGFAVGTVSAVLRDLDLYIRSMAVMPTARGHQLGHHLFAEALNLAVEQRRDGSTSARRRSCTRRSGSTNPSDSGAPASHLTISSGHRSLRWRNSWDGEDNG